VQRSFTVGALAVAAEGANAVGAVRVTLEEARLDVELVRVAPFAEGFAPGAVARAVRFSAPYTAVRGLVRTRHALCLAFDPRVVKPHNRFALTRFTEEPAEALAEAWRARLRARAASWILPLPLGIGAAAVVPGELAGGSIGLAAIAVLVAGASFWALREAADALTSGGSAARELGEAFEAELSRRLGLAAPASAHRSSRAARLEPPPVGAFVQPEGAPGAVAPRRLVAAPLVTGAAATPGEPARYRLPLTIALAAAGAVVTMALLATWARTPPPAPEPEPPDVAASPSPVATAVPEPAAVAPQGPPRAGPPCTCARADSPLWQDGMPVLRVLATPHEGAEAKKPGKLDLDVAAVNDAARPLRDVRVVLTFARRTSNGRRVGVTDRGLFWGGALAPGQAVKWRVRAPGTEVRIDASVTGTLGEDPALVPGAPATAASPPPAPPEAFAPLATARLRSVRLHAATMLAYLRDPKAADAARDLGATSPEEAVAIARLGRASAPVVACGLRVEGTDLVACVMNGSTEVAEGLVLREIAAPKAAEGDAAPAVDAPPGRAWPIAGVVPVHEGARIRVPLEGQPAPVEVEVARGERP
jgi:hypothetical protein